MHFICYDQPMQHMVMGGGGLLSGCWGGCRAYRGTNLLLRVIIELYPDLLLGRR